VTAACELDPAAHIRCAAIFKQDFYQSLLSSCTTGSFCARVLGPAGWLRERRAPFRIHIIYTAHSRISASLLQRIQLRIYGFCALENTLPYVYPRRQLETQLLALIIR
jgi:hypothetical protein